MITYTVTIDAKPCYEDIYITEIVEVKSQYEMPYSRLRQEAIKKLPRCYIEFRNMQVQTQYE